MVQKIQIVTGEMDLTEMAIPRTNLEQPVPAAGKKNNAQKRSDVRDQVVSVMCKIIAPNKNNCIVLK